MGGNTFEKDLLVLIREHKGEVESLVPAFRHMYEKKKGMPKLLHSSCNQKNMPSDVARKRIVRLRDADDATRPLD